MKKIFLISASILSLLTSAPINAQSDTDNIFEDTMVELQELNFSNTEITDFNKIASVIELIKENIKAIESSDEDEQDKINWIKELEMEAILKIKNLLDNKEEVQDETAEAETVTNTEDVSREAKNALGTAESYLSFSSFSKQGLYDQLLYEKYPEEAAQYAVDNIQTDWNENALGTAKSYLDFTSFSDAGLYDQLLYEGYTDEQAQYAIDNLD